MMVLTPGTLNLHQGEPESPPSPNYNNIMIIVIWDYNSWAQY